MVQSSFVSLDWLTGYESATIFTPLTLVTWLEQVPQLFTCRTASAQRSRKRTGAEYAWSI